MALAPASAQTYSVLYNFDGTNAGNPGPDLVLSGQTLYGTGHPGQGGLIYKVGVDGLGFSVINYSFIPGRGLALSGSTLYGTRLAVDYDGAVFSMQTDGSGFTVLKGFPLSDGGGDPNNLVLSGRTLYGTLDLYGSLFSMGTDGSSFTRFFPTNGSLNGNVNCPMVVAGSFVYGTTFSGGNSGGGVVFAMRTNGRSFATLKEFSSGPQASDGAYPMAGLVLSGSTLYGTTCSGGASNAGTIFRINTDGSGFAVLRSLSGDGGSCPLGLVMSGSNVLYGATANSGYDPQQGASPWGNIFQIKTDGSDFAVLKRFTGGKDGSSPAVGFVTNGTLCGTVASGGVYGAGVVFTLSVPAGPFIVPSSQNAVVGASRMFIAKDLLPEPMTTYQWFFNGTNQITGATNAVLQLTNIQFAQAGNYVVAETTASGSLTSPPAALTVLPWTHDLTDYSQAALTTAIGAGGRVMLAVDGMITLSDTITNLVDVALDGTGHQVTLSGGGSVRPLCVGSNTTLSLISLTISGGFAPDAQGGAILNPGGILNVTNCTFAGNLATNATGGPAQGGAIFSTNGQVALDHCTFVGNAAGGLNANYSAVTNYDGAGGAVYSVGVLTARFCTFAGNSAVGGSPAYVGGNGPYDGPGGAALGGALCCLGLMEVADSASAPPTDQRGFPRPSGSADMGAYGFGYAFILEAAHPPHGGVDISVNGLPGRVCRLLTSTDLVTWTAIATKTFGPSGVFVVHDPAGAGQTQRFYRAVMP